MNSIVNFMRGVPAVEALVSLDLLNAAVSAFTEKSSSNSMLQYGSALGLYSFRLWLANHHGVNVNNILIGNSSLELLGFIGRSLAVAGDTVFVESPTYDRAIAILRSCGLKVIGIPMTSSGIDLDVLELELEKAKPRFLYTIPDFQNPSGACMSLDCREKLVRTAEKHGFLLVEDGPYRKLRYFGEEISSLFVLSPDNCVHLTSFSKIIGPGVRVGYLIGSGSVVEKVGNIAEQNYISPNYFAQGIVDAWCRAGKLGPQLVKLRELYAPRLTACVDAADEFFPGALLFRPEGGFFASLMLTAPPTSLALKGIAASFDVQLTNGDAFFTESPARCFVRLPFCALSPNEIHTGISRLKKAVDSAY